MEVNTESIQDIFILLNSALFPLLEDIFGIDLCWDRRNGIFITVYCRGYEPTQTLFEVTTFEYMGIPVLILTPPGKNLKLDELEEAKRKIAKAQI